MDYAKDFLKTKTNNYINNGLDQSDINNFYLNITVKNEGCICISINILANPSNFKHWVVVTSFIFIDDKLFESRGVVYILIKIFILFPIC